MRRLMMSLGVTSMLGLVACGAADGDERADELANASGGDDVTSGPDVDEPSAMDQLPDNIPDSGSVMVHELNVGDETLAFFAQRGANGLPSTLVRSHTSAYQQSALQGLFEQYGLLTAIETFYALSDGSVEPNELLAEAHEAQALDAGRSDLSIQRLTFTPDVVPKLSAGACDDWIFDTSFLPSGERDGGIWGYHAPVTTSPVHTTTSRRDLCQKHQCNERWRTSQVVGICSEGPVESRSVQNDGNGWVAGPWETLTGAVRWFRWMPGMDTHLSVQSKNQSSANEYVQRANQVQFRCDPRFTCFPPHSDQWYR